MAMIPLRLCPKCGTYHDVTAAKCGCGADISRVAAKAVEETAIAPDKRGKIDTALSVYVQKCSGCGTENYTTDPKKPVRVCCNCHRTRVATVAPSPFVIAEPKEETPDLQAQEQAREEAQEDEKVGRWQSVLENTQNAAQAIAKAPQPQDEDDEDDEDDDDDAVGGWGAVLGDDAPKTEPKKPKVSSITFTALRYGQLTFTLTADRKDLPYMLGREANHGEFLQQDVYVGRRHCAITYEAGLWLVIDNNAQNGTAVNGRFLDLGARQVLRNGDELMLGHHTTSMAFRVTIG